MGRTACRESQCVYKGALYLRMLKQIDFVFMFCGKQYKLNP